MDAQLGLFPDLPAAAARPPVGPARSDQRALRLAEALPARLRLGTSSWSFPGWEGLVFDRRASPATLARHGLPAYAAHPLLRTVGVDRTYYRSLKVDEFRTWAAEVPDDFRFLVKADRLLTSPLNPEDSGIRGPNSLFLDPAFAAAEVVGPIVEGLGAKAGPILFQFPPVPGNLVGGRTAFTERLHRFLEALPSGPLYAVELRTPAFLTEAYAHVLEATGATHCFNVHPAMSPLRRQLEVLQPYDQPAFVVRWMLHADFRYEVARERYEPFDRLVDEDATSRDRIAVAALDALIAERDVFVVANNKAEGSAPLTVFRLAERIAGWGDSEVAPHAS